ncbi:CCA tRNA nucleotidyltransferase [Candidatus Gottesmanbacteria bacterium]|nr:CCA tRNA nucleotidyltransferase [Candidatus Gottesmanbacteria bacterium]
MTNLPQPTQLIISTLKKAGFEAYAIGGSVRDLLMDKPTKGWDFTTNAKPEEILKLFPDSFYDNQFGTVGIKITSKENPEITEDIYEITTYRSEKGYKDHRHPDKIIWGKTVEEDLGRRDFTINAIAFDGKNFIDPFDGRKDIEKKIIRAVGDPNARLSEDALRMMRAVRIASELGFFIDEDTLSAIKKNVGQLLTISAERIRDELLKLLASGYPADGILLLKNSGILEKILPEMDTAFGVPQKSPKRHHIYDVGTHSVMAVKFCPSSDPIVRLATLLHDVGKPKTFQKEEKTGVITFYNHEVVGANIAKEIARRLRLSKKQSEKLVTLIRWHQFTVDERQTDSALRRLIRRVGKENLDDMLALRIGDRLGGGALETSWRLELFKKRLEEVQKQPFTVADLNINGHDVMRELNCAPGPMVGKLLNQLFTEVEAGTLPNERDALLKRLGQLKLVGVSASPIGPKE